MALHTQYESSVSPMIKSPVLLKEQRFSGMSAQRTDTKLCLPTSHNFTVFEPLLVTNLLPFGENEQDLNFSTLPLKYATSFLFAMLSAVPSFPYKTKESSGEKMQQEMRSYPVGNWNNLISSGKLRTLIVPSFNATAAQGRRYRGGVGGVEHSPTRHQLGKSLTSVGKTGLAKDNH